MLYDNRSCPKAPNPMADSTLLLLCPAALCSQVPDVDWLLEKIQGFVDSGVLNGQYDRVWVNPDCGLKTRRWAEVIPSLKHMVEAAAIMRERLAAGKVVAGTGAGAAKAQTPAGTAVAGSNGCVAGCCH